MKLKHARTVRHLTILIVLGGVCTILSAWASAWWSNESTQAFHESYDMIRAPKPWIRPVPKNWPSKPTGITHFVLNGHEDFGHWNDARIRIRQGMHSGITFKGGKMTFQEGSPESEYAIDVILTGWPFQTMQRRDPGDARPKSETLIGRLVKCGIPVPAYKLIGLKAGRRLPLQPMWGWFLLSVLLWGVGIEKIWQLVRVPAHIRRNKWLKQNQCLRCGYPLEGLIICPECGTPRA